VLSMLRLVLIRVCTSVVSLFGPEITTLANMFYNKLELIPIVTLFLKKYHNSLSLTVRCGHVVKHIKSKHTRNNNNNKKWEIVT